MMKSFRVLPASKGPRRKFKITVALRAGYGPAGRIYDLEEAVRAARGEPFLSGMFTRGEVVYAEGGAANHREPVAIVAGEVLPQYAGDLDDRTVRELLENWPARWVTPLNKRKYTSHTVIEPGRSTGSQPDR